MTKKKAKTLLLGLGNMLLGDEGVGVHAARALMNEEFAGDVTILDVGTAILDALPAIEEADSIIIVDAVKADGQPGTIYRMPFDDFLRPQCIASMHGFDLSRVLALTKKAEPPEVLVIGVEPARIDWSLDLSKEVSAVLPAVVELIRQEIKQ